MAFSEFVVETRINLASISHSASASAMKYVGSGLVNAIGEKLVTDNNCITIIEKWLWFCCRELSQTQKLKAIKGENDIPWLFISVFSVWVSTLRSRFNTYSIIGLDGITTRSTMSVFFIFSLVLCIPNTWRTNGSFKTQKNGRVHKLLSPMMSLKSGVFISIQQINAFKLTFRCKTKCDKT